MINTGDTGFILICAALVLLMTPGLAFFYGGMVRRKNVVNTMMTSIFVIGIAMVMWVLFGYSLAFGNDHFGIIGDLSFLGLNGIGLQPGSYADSIPSLEYAAFQMMFAIITPALITGAVAGRMKFKALFIFIIAWSTIVYYPMAHMVWGLGGILAKIGSVDFAGGNVVHISSGVSALILCIVLGKRKDYDHAKYRIHNIPFVVLGASLLLFGWFGFNAGSALKANGLAVHAFMTTAVSAAAGMLSWMAMDVWMNKKPTLVGSVTGLIVGLVAITPGAGYVPIWSAIIIGLVGSPICYLMISKGKKRFGYDDALDAFGCHGIGGIWGGIATGLFAQTSINSVARWNGLFFGDTQLLVAQIISILVTILVAVAGTLICIAIVRLFTTLRVEKREEQIGLDISQHNETAYPSFNGLD
ncbi:ammonia permease [Erysipelatoclostridium sp. An173]|uniref:ammonium transporter n=1 Tax=unclassified Thomasclavelia TaxID=3025756 RepID=UPI000B384B19|nr:MULTISPECIES: ammonium transporter [unclassified Thomasclavelia]OUP72377.1 ammonia permease [Erysipelatoclostridium sp. An173]